MTACSGCDRGGALAARRPGRGRWLRNCHRSALSSKFGDCRLGEQNLQEMPEREEIQDSWQSQNYDPFNAPPTPPLGGKNTLPSPPLRNRVPTAALMTARQRKRWDWPLSRGRPGRGKRLRNRVEVEAPVDLCLSLSPLLLSLAHQPHPRYLRPEQVGALKMSPGSR
jgi:hypothetical protein